MVDALDSGSSGEFLCGGSSPPFDSGKIMDKKIRKENEFLKAKIKAYEKYLPLRIVEKINTDPYDVRVQGERRFVSILFGDVSGFTALSERLDPEDVIKVINKYFNKMLYVVEKYGGDVDKFVGDAIMVVFGAPVAHKDDPERAVRAALEMQEAIETIDPVLAKGEYIKVRMSIGVNTGEIVALNMGTDDRMEYTVMGDNVNLSARLESVANATEVIISDRTHKYIKDVFEFETLEPVSVKGKKEPIQIYKVLSVKDKRTSRRDIPLIGYDKEIVQVDENISGFLKNKSFSLQIIGKEGTGKSKIIDYIYDIADRKNIDVFSVKGESFAKNIPFHSLREALSSYLQISPTSGTDTIKGKIDNIFKKEFRNGCYYLFNLIHSESLKKDMLHQAIIQSLIGLTGIYTSKNRVIFCMEDMHYFDEHSIDIINKFIKKSIDNQGIAFVFSSRNEFKEKCDNVIKTKEFNKSLTDKILQHILNSKNISMELRTLIFKKTGGNPGYITEFANYLKNNDILKISNKMLCIEKDMIDKIPDSLKSVFLEKMDILNEGAKRFLQYASVIGLKFNKADMLNVYKFQDIEIDEYLKDLTNIEYLQFEGNDIYTFNSELFYNAVYNSLMQNTRREVHNSLGQYYEGLVETNTRFLRKTSYHYDEAKNEIKAPVFLEKNGDLDKDLFAYESAGLNYQKAIGYLENNEDVRIHNKVLFKNVLIHVVIGKLKKALEELEKNKERSMKFNDQKSGYYNYHGLINEKMGNIEQADTDYKLSLKIAESIKDNDLIAKINNNLGIMKTIAGKYKESLKHFNTALSISIRNNDWNDIASQYINIGRIYSFMGDSENAEIFLKKAIDILTEHNDEPRIIVAKMNLAYVYDTIGRKEDSKKIYSAIVELSQKINDNEMRLKSLNNLAVIDYTAGNLDSALSAFKRIELIHSESENIRELAEVKANIAELEMSMGNFENARNGFEETVKLCNKCNHLHLLIYINVFYASTLMMMGYLHKASVILEENIERSKEMNMPDFEIMSINVLAKIRGVSGNLKGEIEMLKNALKLAEKLKNPGLIFDIKLTITKAEIETGNYEKASIFGNEVIEFAEKSGNEILLSDAFATMSDLYQRTENIEKLSEIAARSFEIAEKTKSSLSGLRNYISLGRFYLLAEDLSSCELTLKTAEKLSSEIKSIEHIIMLYKIFIKLYSLQKSNELLIDAWTKYMSSIDEYIINAGGVFSKHLLSKRKFVKSYADYIVLIVNKFDSDFVVSQLKHYDQDAIKSAVKYIRKEKLLSDKQIKLL